jgi:hypothetical protein
MPRVRLFSLVRRVMVPLAAWLGGRRRQPEVPISMSLRTTPADETKPSVPAAYMPLYTYLNRRYATTVVLTFEQMEALLGFAPPSPASVDAAWWTTSGPGDDHHTSAWLAARRSAKPHLSARVVAFERNL